MAEATAQPAHGVETRDGSSAPRVLVSDQGFWTIAWRQYAKDRISIAGLIVVALLIGFAVVAPFLANGLPYTITGVLTNFYTSDVAAFRDWHQRYRQVADELEDPSKLAQFALVEKEADAERYRRGLPRILHRLESYMKDEDASSLRELAKKYEKLLEPPPARLEREEYDALGREIDERFGGLAFESAYKKVLGPIASFLYGDSGGTPLKKRVSDAAEDARNAADDKDAKALAAAQKALAALAPELAVVADNVETNAKGMAAFFPEDAAKELADTARELASAIRSFGDPATDAQRASDRFDALSSKIDAFARRPIDPARQRLPRTTKHPVIEYLRPRDVALLVLYATVLLAIAFRGAFSRATRKLPLDPSDLGLARIGILVAPGLLAAVVWWALVPEREPPSDTYYKSFMEDLAAHPDPASSITFAPVPFGENENIQPDKVCPPTWIEDLDHEVARIRTPEDRLPPGVSDDELREWLDPRRDDKGDVLVPREKQPKAQAIAPWVDALLAKRLTRFRYHWLGTDKGGRDVLARLIIGSRVSLSVGVVAVGINVFIGIVLGALAGFFGGWMDIVISRLTEVMMCFPSFFLILTVLAITKPSIWNVMFVIGLTGWTGEMRLVRGEFLRLVNLDFVTAGRALGLSDMRVIFRHVLPNAMAPLLVAATFGIAGAILTESALSFLGFGVPPPEASWGSVLNEAFGAEKEMWWITIFPGFMIFLTITAYNLVGEGFRDATDPRLRK